MTLPNIILPLRKYLPLTVMCLLAGSPLAAHEAWLLTPDEIERLVAAPMPAVFTSWIWLGIAAILGACATGAALWIEDHLHMYETRLAAPLARRARSVGPLMLRLGLAVMLILAAFGGLPRHGTAPWTKPTFLVPDMQLLLFPGWDWLVSVQIALAIVLLLGICTRLAGLFVIGLSVLGLVMAGPTFIAYAPHFAAPGLMLVLAGGGALSLDRVLLRDTGAAFDPIAVQIGWRVAQILIGFGFVYLAVAYKLTQPTLLIAILEHGNLPTFGLPYPVVALVMTWVEIICGALLILGRLVRPVAFVIIGAITTLAVGLGETPLFHANLYGAMAFLVLAGHHLPRTYRATAPLWKVAA